MPNKPSIPGWPSIRHKSARFSAYVRIQSGAASHMYIQNCDAGGIGAPCSRVADRQIRGWYRDFVKSWLETAGTVSYL